MPSWRGLGSPAPIVKAGRDKLALVAEVGDRADALYAGAEKAGGAQQASRAAQAGDDSAAEAPKSPRKPHEVRAQPHVPRIPGGRPRADCSAGPSAERTVVGRRERAGRRPPRLRVSDAQCVERALIRGRLAHAFERRRREPRPRHSRRGAGRGGLAIRRREADMREADVMARECEGGEGTVPAGQDKGHRASQELGVTSKI